MDKLLATIVGLIVILIALLLLSGSLYLVGLLVVNVFKINFTWTFIHAFALTFVLAVLRSIFK